MIEVITGTICGIAIVFAGVLAARLIDTKKGKK